MLALTATILRYSDIPLTCICLPDFPLLNRTTYPAIVFLRLVFLNHFATILRYVRDDIWCSKSSMFFDRIVRT